jgi:ABC-type uncharacterized transport system substrate-binding protein/ABC-type nickel/cobalt efflux system permease component RcnA
MYRRAAFTLLLLLFIQALLPAHPHMWIRGNLKPVLGERGLVAVDVRWKFDEFSNASFINDYDRNGDGTIDSAESETIRRESLNRLFADEYYLIVDIGGLRGTPLKVQEFRASIENGELIYKFRVPLEITIRWEDLNRVGIFLFDPSYFIDFRNDGMEKLTVVWQNRTVEFSLAERELETRGYGRVRVSGLQAGESSGMETSRKSISALIKEKSFLLQERLGAYTRRVINDRDPRAFRAALGLAIVFGLLHVMGPGHGKIFTLAYFSSRQAKLREGLMLSGLINILDSLSAFLLVGITYGILSLTIQNTGALVGRITRIVAYGSITAIGAGFVIAHFLGRASRSGSHRNRENHKSREKQLKPWMLAVSVGLIPCPVSSALLAYGIAENALWFSIILVAGVSLGGMIALSIYSFLIIAGKAGMVRMLQYSRMEKFLEWFEVFSMALLAVFGGVLLIGIL